MAVVSYDIRVYDAFGEELGSLNDFESFSLSLKENDYGAVTISSPNRPLPSIFKKDGRIALFRSVNGRIPVLLGNTHWLIRKQTKTKNQGRTGYSVTALHANCLLERRIVAYNAGTSYTNKTDFADDMIKEVVRENLGASATDTDRRLSSSIFSVQADVGAGPTVAKAFTRRGVLDVCKEIADTAAGLGTYVGFEIFALSDSDLELRTYIGQRGINRGANSGQAFYVPLDNVSVDDDWVEELTYVYAGGLGTEANRAIGTASDATLIGESPFGRIEHFWDGRQTDDTALLDDDAEALLRANRPRKIISGDIQDSDSAIFGVHYDFGDIVAVDVDGDIRDVRLDTFALNYSRATGERIATRVRSGI